MPSFLTPVLTREEEIKKQHDNLETITRELEQQKNLDQQKDTNINQLKELIRQKDDLITQLTEKAETLNSSLEQSKSQFLNQTIAIKELEESGYKKELIIKDMENSLLKKELVVQELTNKVFLSQTKTIPEVNQELLFLKEQLTDKNLIIELLKTKAEHVPISDFSLESLNIEEEVLKPKNPPIQQPKLLPENSFIDFDNLHITKSVLLSGDVSLVEEEDSI